MITAAREKGYSEKKVILGENHGQPRADFTSFCSPFLIFAYALNSKER
jgi:hypothetical protein